MLTISKKEYACTKCGGHFHTETNHYGEIYRSPCCGFGVTANFVGKVPEGGFVPKPWTKVDLSTLIRVVNAA